MENANGSYKQTKKGLLKNFNTWRLIHNIRSQCPSCEQLYLGIFALIFFERRARNYISSETGKPNQSR